MATNLVLGGVLFQSFELPERIDWGGAQRLALHRLPGGGRVIDAMGRDDGRITWSGVFSGPDAGDRARLIDLMRAAGNVLPLSWDSFFYSAVIDSFRAEYAQLNWIPYRISCTVLRDEAQSVVTAALSLGTAALSDLAAAGGAGVDVSAATAAVGATGATIRGSTAYGAAVLAVGDVAASLDSAVSGGEAALVAADVASSAGLEQAAAICGQLAGLVAARGFVERVSVNLANAST
jgi:hypothetical protein